MAKLDADERRLPHDIKELAKIVNSSKDGQRAREVLRDAVAAIRLAFRQARNRQVGTFDEAIEREIAILQQKHGRGLLEDFLHRLIEVLEVRREDVLGPLYMAVSGGNVAAGQFFTPVEVARLTASINAIGSDAVYKRDGRVELHEPACGSGGLTFAYVDAAGELGVPRQRVFATMVDIDRLCCDMSYVQATLLAIPARVIHGDVLRMEEWSVDETIFWPLPAAVPMKRKGKRGA